MMQLTFAGLIVMLMAFPAAAQKSESETPYEKGRRSVREGLERAIQDNKRHDGDNKDPELEKSFERYRKGYGPEPKQMMRQVLDKMGASASKVPSERNLTAMGNVYSFYVERGDFDQARKAASEIARFYENAKRRYATIEKFAAGTGIVREGDAVPIAAYADIQSSGELRIISLNGDGYRISYVSRDGSKVTRTVRPPKVIAAFGMGFPVDTFEEDLLSAIHE